MALDIVTKRDGDLLTATEFNAVVQAIKDNERSVDTLGTNYTNMGKTVEGVQKAQNLQGQDIKTLNANMVKMVSLTQEAYDALVTAGTVDRDERPLLWLESGDSGVQGSKARVGGYQLLLRQRYVAELASMEKYGRLEKLKR